MTEITITHNSTTVSLKMDSAITSIGLSEMIDRAFESISKNNSNNSTITIDATDLKRVQEKAYKTQSLLDSTKSNRIPVNTNRPVMG